MVVDATRLERNLNLVLQILEITDRVVVCLNLVDEARRHGISVDARRLERELGVPVVPAVARRGEGIDALLEAAAEVASGARRNRPRRVESHPPAVEEAVNAIAPLVAGEFPELPNARWVALRLLNADERVTEAVRSGEIGELNWDPKGGDSRGGLPSEVGPPPSRDDGGEIPPGRARILKAATRLRWTLRPGFHDALAENLYREATRIAETSVRRGTGGDRRRAGPAAGPVAHQPGLRLPPHAGRILAVVFWLTIAGANVPSAMLATLLLDNVHPALLSFGEWARMPWWLSGFLFDGVYLATAWVVSVMLPPMAIFFPLFTLLEDFGYLPRVAFNLDSLFRRAGAHGKQALTMSMGFGCNAAGVVATRVIDSPRERLIAIVTNNFSLCNGRWPTQILIATIFIGALAPPHLAGAVSAGAVVGDRAAGDRLRLPHLVGALPHGAEGRGQHLLAGASPLPPPARAADALHLGHRPHPDHPVARRPLRRPRRRGHLAALEHPGGRRVAGRTRHRPAGPVRRSSSG